MSPMPVSEAAVSPFSCLAQVSRFVCHGSTPKTSGLRRQPRDETGEGGFESTGWELIGVSIRESEDQIEMTQPTELLIPPPEGDSRVNAPDEIANILATHWADV